MYIRELEEKDRDKWVSLRAKLWPDSTPIKILEESYIITNGGSFEEKQLKWQVFVIECPDEKLGGFIEVSIRPYEKCCTTQPVGFIEGWYVDTEIRRGGWGRKLVEEAEKWVLAQGCTQIASDTDSYRKVSIESHQAVGYTVTYRDKVEVRFKKELAR